MYRRAKGIRQANVVSVREHLLIGLGIPPDELAQRAVVLLDNVVKLRFSHLDPTSILWRQYMPSCYMSGTSSTPRFRGHTSPELTLLARYRWLLV